MRYLHPKTEAREKGWCSKCYQRNISQGPTGKFWVCVSTGCDNYGIEDAPTYIVLQEYRKGMLVIRKLQNILDVNDWVFEFESTDSMFDPKAPGVCVYNTCLRMPMKNLSIQEAVDIAMEWLR